MLFLITSKEVPTTSVRGPPTKKPRPHLGQTRGAGGKVDDLGTGVGPKH